MKKITEYERNFKFILYGFGCISLFSAIILFNLGFPLIYKILIWFFLICIPHYVGYCHVKRLDKILIDENNYTIGLIFRKFDINTLKFIEINEIYNTSEVSFIYKYQRTSKGSKYKRLDLFYNNKKLAELGLAYDGWKEEFLEAIYQKLKNLRGIDLSPALRSV